MQWQLLLIQALRSQSQEDLYEFKHALFTKQVSGQPGVCEETLSFKN